MMAETEKKFSPLLERLVAECLDSYAYGNDGMYFVEDLDDLADMGFTEADLDDLEAEVAALEMDTVVEASPDFADYGDPIITVYANAYEYAQRIKYGGARLALGAFAEEPVLLHDEDNGLYVKLQYLEDNSYADYDIAVYDEKGYEIVTSAGGIGWEDAEDEEAWEPEQNYTFYEVAEAVNDELANCWPTRFNPDRAIIELFDDSKNEMLDLFDDREEEEMEFIRSHSREEVMARRAERAMYAARTYGVEGWGERKPGELKQAIGKPAPVVVEAATPGSDEVAVKSSAAARGVDAATHEMKRQK